MFSLSTLYTQAWCTPGQSTRYAYLYHKDSASILFSATTSCTCPPGYLAAMWLLISSPRSLVISRLDYGNASLIRPSRFINAAVRLVNALRLRDHVTWAAIDLQWLPAAEARPVRYTLCPLVHRAHAGSASTYVMDIHQPVAVTSLRSAVGNTTDSLFILRTLRKLVSKLSQSLLPAWNQLPRHLSALRRPLCQHNTNTSKQKT